MRPRFALLACLLVVVAGCAAPTSQSGPPPGLSTDNVTDANALVRAHTDALQSQSFTVRSTTTMYSANGSFRVVSNRTWHVDPGEPIRGRVVSSRRAVGDAPARYTGPTRVAAWRNGTTTYRRADRNGTPTYQRVPLFDSRVKLSSALQRNDLYRLSTRRNATVEAVERDGRRLYRVTAALNDTAVASNASMTLLVDANGVVRTLKTEQTVQFRAGKREISTTAHVTRVGSTTVERPDWYGAAVEATENGTTAG